MKDKHLFEHLLLIFELYFSPSLVTIFLYDRKFWKNFRRILLSRWRRRRRRRRRRPAFEYF